MRTWLALAAVSVAVLAAGGSATAVGGAAAPVAAPAQGLGDPAAFVERVVRQIVANDYARAWLTLHPEHRRAAGRWEYVDCEAQTPIEVDLGAVEVLSVADARKDVGAAKAVRLRLTLVDPELGSAESEHTFHAVAVGGRWTWVLPDERLATYRDDACAGGPAA